MPVTRRRRGRSVDTGGLALALSDQTQGLGHGWGGWEETETGETRYAEVLIDVRAHTEGIVNSGYDRYPFHLLAHEPNRRRLIESLSSWNFEPHKLTSDEVLCSALLLFEAFLCSTPEGLVCGVGLDHLPPFLYHLQNIYRQTNTYHNFEHALDVLQALYHFLSEVGAVRSVLSLLQQDDKDSVPSSTPPTPSILDVLSQEDIFALCIAAVGHDVGHPGLTNAFMKNAQTPLAVLYDDKSVLEQMHYALILQVMRHTGLGILLDGSTSPHGNTGCKKLMLSTILVTDLSLHDQFMRDFTELVENPGHFSDPFKAKMLACQALIKCADISNPARPYTVSQHWAAALSSEWSSQVVLEKHLHLPPSVYPSVDALGEAKGQVFFIERFAGPLFKLIGRGIPQLEKFSAQCHENLTVWKQRLELFSKEAESSHGESESPKSGQTVKFISSRVTSPEDFLSAFPPTLPKSFIDGQSFSGSSAYETCESSPPGSPEYPTGRVGPPRLEITTSASPKRTHSRSHSHSQKPPPNISSPSYHLVSPSSHHRAPSLKSNHSNITSTTSASVSANATAAIREAYKKSVRKKPSTRSFNRSSWNPPPTEYSTFVTAPASPRPLPTPSPPLPPVIFTTPGFIGSSDGAEAKRYPPAASALLAARFVNGENLSPLTPDSGTTVSLVSPLTPQSSIPSNATGRAKSEHEFDVGLPLSTHFVA
ncbi:HD-domain/PDEase-like protein [Cristinia sonorae]|uniref:Phosphodiesterase n=1 Tax=Cristinia sonorae TaxID=1940300 RepID=A0A8K0XKX1_9AGAR|nr:HD-domain/PDEase-like protein [Cristinia sonorae]